jgi:exosortase K
VSRDRAVTLAAAAPYAAAAGAAYGLKAYFSAANADALQWVLAPTCWLAGHLGGIVFVYEPGAGFISHTERLVVGLACSGLNFLIICFAALFFSLAHRFEGAWRRVAWLVGCFGLAYVATILVNAARVIIAAHLYHLPLEGGFLTPARLHRLMGTVLYCVALVALHRLADRWTDARPTAQPGATWLVPLACYLGLTLVVPLARHPSLGGDARFLEHAAFVVGTLLAIGALALAARAAAGRLGARRQGSLIATSNQ